MSKMIEVKTADLVGAALDWATGIVAAEPNGPGMFEVAHGVVFKQVMDGYSPSTDWSQGGQLIDKYRLEFCVEHEDVICAVLCDENGMQVSEYRHGETHLIAACRAIASAKLGDVVQVPAELVETQQ